MDSNVTCFIENIRTSVQCPRHRIRCQGKPGLVLCDRCIDTHFSECGINKTSLHIGCDRIVDVGKDAQRRAIIALFKSSDGDLREFPVLEVPEVVLDSKPLWIHLYALRPPDAP